MLFFPVYVCPILLSLYIHSLTFPFPPKHTSPYPYPLSQRHAITRRQVTDPPQLLRHGCHTVPLIPSRLGTCYS